MRRRPYWALVIVGAALAAWGFTRAIQSSRQVACFVVEDTDRDIGQSLVGSKNITIHVRNVSGQDGWLFGMGGSCGKNCCTWPKLKYRAAIPSGQDFSCSCDLNVINPGAFEGHVQLYLYALDYEPVDVTIRGIAVAGGEKPDEPRKP
jgi:hypothetical protein